ARRSFLAGVLINFLERIPGAAGWSENSCIIKTETMEVKMELLYKKINDYQVGERVDSFLIIKRVDLKTTNSNGKKYLDFILGDATGEITAKLWEVPPELEGFFEANMVVRVRGMINLYQNQLQFKIERIRLRNDEDPV